ncbi:MAG: hypothetical protein LUD17_08995 [Bacteroidales bacterium]|nr:hypothetical protein [Bacteroidales bacterium]
METLLDKYKKYAAECDERKANIEALSASLDEANLLLAVMPDSNLTFEQIQELRCVADRIKFLRALIADEQKAIENNEPSDEDIEGIVDLM